MRPIPATRSSLQRRAAYKAHRTMCEAALKTARAIKTRSHLAGRIKAYRAIVEASA